MSTNASTDQIAMLQSLLAAVNALKDSVGIAAQKTSSKKSSTSRSKKEKDPNAPKRPLNPKIAAQNEERKTIYEEMQSAYFKKNPSAASLDPKEIRKMAKEGKLPPFPTYPQALKEHSRRMRAADPEHDKKAQAYRDRIDAKQAETKKEKGSKKSSEASSIASGNSEAAAEIVTADDAPNSPLPPSPPTPAPAPAAEEKKPRGRPKKIASAPAPAPAPEPQPEITVTAQTSDPEEFNMNLKMPDGKTYLLNAKNWVLDSGSMEWVGIYDSAKKSIDTNAPEPE